MAEQKQENIDGDPHSAKGKGSKSIAARWGGAVTKMGYCPVPALLLRAQRRLGLNPSQLAVLLQIIEHWWDASRDPYPSKAELSDRLGISERQVQRYIRELEENGLLTRIAYFGESGGRENNRYDLSGLVKRLAEIAPDFIAEREERKRKRKAAAMPGGGRRRTPGVRADSTP
jgi:DNA-binding transcriptional ArsR family regulator